MMRSSHHANLITIDHSLFPPAAAAFVCPVAVLLLVRGFVAHGGALLRSALLHAPTVEQVSNEILGDSKGRDPRRKPSTQLQVVQDHSPTQQTETKKLSEPITTCDRRA